MYYVESNPELSTVLSVSVSRSVRYERFYCIRAYVGEFFHEFSRRGQLILYMCISKSSPSSFCS